MRDARNLDDDIAVEITAEQQRQFDLNVQDELDRMGVPLSYLGRTRIERALEADA